MSKQNAQAVVLESPSPLALPFTTKEQAKKWLEFAITRQGLTQPLLDKAIHLLANEINIEGRSWNELENKLKPFYIEWLLFEQQKIQQFEQQIVQVDLPTPVLRDPRVDALARKYNELEIAKKIKQEIVSDLENTEKRLKSDTTDNYDKIQKLRRDLVERDDTIAELRNKLKELTREKEELEKKIEGLENEIEVLKCTVERLQVTVDEKDQKIERLMVMHAERMQKVSDEALDMKEKARINESRIKELENRNEELAKMNESRIVVGETMKIMIKAIYKYVHREMPLTKWKSYAIRDISDHMTKYKDNAPKLAAQERWDILKGTCFNIRCTMRQSLHYCLYIIR